MKRLVLLTLLSGVLALLVSAPAQSQDTYIRSLHLGIDHISAPSDPIVDQRYRNALFLGAGWNRWPLYWNSIETAPLNYNWSAYDQLVANDVRYGLRSDAIFLGIPGGEGDPSSTIRGLYDPVFSDGSDTPGSGKQPNPTNAYASFVYAAVQRYKPGGVLAGQLGWTPDQGIRVWEAWNEPDLPMFWGGSVQNYARLLQVTYLVVHQVDPLAQVMFGGLAYNNPGANDWLANTLAVLAHDPHHAAYNWYFDIAAVHSYSDPLRSARMVAWVKEVLRAYGLDRPVWLNESGIPVWNDYPGPTWTANSPNSRLYRGTLREQALYVIESTALAWGAGADVVFYFQLYDDCGNQPPGTDFPPNDGQAGDAFGLYRNDRSSPCFKQSPQPDTPRPAATAYYRMAQLFGDRDLLNGTNIVLQNGRGRVTSFDLSPQHGVTTFGPVTTNSVGTGISERAYVMWNRSPERIVVEIPSSGPSAQLYDMSNNDYLLTPQDGKYEIGLPPVSSSDFPQLASWEVKSISGAPYILIEQVPQGWTPVDPTGVHIQGTENTNTTEVAQVPTQPAALFIPTDIPTPIPRPTIDPSQDKTPPVPTMQPLPEISPATFTVQWGGTDDSGIAQYVVWVRVDGGDWQPWLQTTDTQADYTGESGSTYDFAVWAQDLAGNWSENVELTPMATTRVQ